MTDFDSAQHPRSADDGRFAAKQQTKPELTIAFPVQEPQAPAELAEHAERIAAQREVMAAAEREYETAVGNAFGAYINRTFPTATSVKLLCSEESYDRVPDPVAVYAGGEELWAGDTGDDAIGVELAEYAREIRSPYDGGGLLEQDEQERDYRAYRFWLDGS